MGHRSNVLLPNPRKGTQALTSRSKNFSHKVEDLMNTVFPLMPWKNYTQKKKTKKNSDFLHIYKDKPPSLTSREVEQPVVGSGSGFLPEQQFLRGSHPRGGRQESTALTAGAWQSLR